MYKVFCHILHLNNMWALLKHPAMNNNQQLHKKTEVSKWMLNLLGHPYTSYSATFAYCTELYLDNDEFIIHGCVIKRGKEVTPIITYVGYSNILFFLVRLVIERQTLYGIITNYS